MNNELNKRWTLLSEAKRSFEEELKSWPEEFFVQQPEQSWSASQVLEHILASETGTLGYIQKKSSSGWDQLEVSTLEDNARSTALNNRLESPEKYKAPSILPEPTNQFNLNQLLTKWESIRKELEDFISQVDPLHYDKLVFRQPIAGMLNLMQTLEFLEKHILHHLPQLTRIRQELKF